MISRIALIAASGLLLGAALTPASAADLGGGCCADLEERVAELEATTARKGNRVVTLQVYGTVAKGLLVYDDGIDSDALVVDNDAITSVLGFKGEATMKPGVKAGFNIELYVGDANSNGVSQIDDEGDPGIQIRKSFVYIESERLGRISIGQQSTATDGVTGVSLANTLVGGAPDHGGNLFIPGTALAIGADDLRLSNFASDFDAGRDDVIRYDSPSVYGFILSAAWGDDDYYDIALRFAKEWNSIKIAAAIGYQDSSTDDFGGDFEALTGSISVMHVPTGVFASVFAGQKEVEDASAGGDGEADFWLVQAGLERKWFDYGATTLYGEYGTYNDVATLTQDVTGSEAERYGFGVVQHFDSAAMDLFAQATFWNFELEGAEEEELSTLMVGAKIDF